MSSTPTSRQPPSRNITPRPTHQTRQKIQTQTPRQSLPRDPLDSSPFSNHLGPDHQQTDDFDFDTDSLNEVVMAVDIRERGTVGCSYYVAREEKLYFMEDSKLGGTEVVDTRSVPSRNVYVRCLTSTVKTCVEPTVLLVSNRMDDAILGRLDPDAERRGTNFGDTNHDPGLPYLLEVRPSPEFKYEGAKSKLINLNLEAENGPQIQFIIPGDILAEEDCGVRRQEHLLRLASWIDIESRLTVGCAGAVLSYLQRRRAAGYLPSDSAQHSFFRISSVHMFSMRGTMLATSVSYFAIVY